MWNFENWDFGEEKPKKINIKKKVVEDKAMKLYQKSFDLHTIKARQLSDLCGQPEENEQWRIITEKQFNAFNLILDVITNSNIEELYIAIYRINEPTVRTIKDLIDSGKIKKATFIISNFFLQTKRPEQWAISLKNFCDANKDKCSSAYVHNHAKVICIRDDNDNHFVFEGSGNMNDNARIEQYLYENNKETFSIHKQWMDELCLKMKKND